MRELPQSLLETLKTNFDKNDWKKVCSTFWLSEELIDKYSDRLDWDEVSFHQKLNETTINKYADKLNWKYASEHQKLSEEIMNKYSYKIIDWSTIFRHQKISEDFIRKNIGKLDTSGDISLINKLGKNNYSEEIQLFVLKKMLQKYDSKIKAIFYMCTLTPYMKEQYCKYSAFL